MILHVLKLTLVVLQPCLGHISFIHIAGPNGKMDLSHMSV